MYYPQEPKEPPGCIQTLFITKAIFGILLVPMGIILLAILGILGVFYVLTIHPLLALVTLLAVGGVLYGLARWEMARVKREAPDGDDD